MNDIKIGSERFIKSTNVNTNVKLELSVQEKELIEFDVGNVLKVNELFDEERQNSKKYQIYGCVENMSLLDGLYTSYTDLKYLFNHGYEEESQTSSSSASGTIAGLKYKSMLNSFKFYLAIRSSEYTPLLSSDGYQSYYEIVAELDDVDILRSGYATTIYGNDIYNYIVNSNVDLTEKYDGFELPITDVFLYCEYVPTQNGNGVAETIERTNFKSDGTSVGYVTFNPTTLSVGDRIIGDTLYFDLPEFSVSEIEPISYRIGTTFYDDDDNSKLLTWIYKPFIQIPVDYYSDTVKTGSVESSAYDDANEIPNYAKPISTNNSTYIWRNILEKGFIDPITEVGTSFPFMNNKHYVYNKLNIKVYPDYTNTVVNDIFSELKFGDSNNLGSDPTDDLDDFGKRCK